MLAVPTRRALSATIFCPCLRGCAAEAAEEREPSAARRASWGEDCRAGVAGCGRMAAAADAAEAWGPERPEVVRQVVPELAHWAADYGDAAQAKRLVAAPAADDGREILAAWMKHRECSEEGLRGQSAARCAWGDQMGLLAAQDVWGDLFAVLAAALHRYLGALAERPACAARREVGRCFHRAWCLAMGLQYDVRGGARRA